MSLGELSYVKVRLVDDAAAGGDTLVECQLRLKTLVNADPVYSWPPETKIQRAEQLYTKGTIIISPYVMYYNCYNWNQFSRKQSSPTSL